MKRILLVLLIFPLLFCTGFKKQKPYLILSQEAITNQSIKRIERNFPVKSRIYYALILPDGLKYSGVRMQVSNQNEKTSNWGYSINMTKDLYIDTSSDIYRDYIYIQKPGRYILQFFYLNKKTYPFAHTEFMVY